MRMATRFKLDENIPRDAEALLRESGHDVDTALSEQLGGQPDAMILEAARRERRVLVTFADMRAYPFDHSGVWVLPERRSKALAICLP